MVKLKICDLYFFYRKKFKHTFPPIRTFLATHSGLTRWNDIDSDVKTENLSHFSKTNNKAIDETWYKRAAEENFDQDVFVYSVPFDATDTKKSKKDIKDIVVTASHVVYVKQNNRKAPVAAIGYQFPHKNLVDKFNIITTYLVSK